MYVLNLLKMYEKLLFVQINNHMQSKFSEHIIGFRQNHSAYNALLFMIKKWTAILNKNSKWLVFLWICQKHLTHWMTPYYWKN